MEKVWIAVVLAVTLVFTGVVGSAVGFKVMSTKDLENQPPIASYEVKTPKWTGAVASASGLDQEESQVTEGIVTKEPSDSEVKSWSKTEGVKNFLLLGVDSRSDDLVGRSDAIIVLQLDTNNDTMKTLSIPRDAYVEINGSGNYDKINHSFNKGADATKKTVEDFLGLHIDHYAVVNFSSFTEVVDILGGVTVDVPFSFSEQDANGNKNALSFTEGEATLNGEEALAYARMRKQDPEGDIGRGKRQQQVISGLISQMTSLGNIKNYGEILGSVKSSTETDVSVLTIPSLLGYVKSYTNKESLVLEGKGFYQNKVYYMEITSESLNKVKESLTEGE